jgi:hypothetical protein
LRARKRIKDGRYVGLDFYDLLIEAFTDASGSDIGLGWQPRVDEKRPDLTPVPPR